MEKRRRYKRIPWIRLTITATVLLIITFCTLLVIYGSNSTSNDIAFISIASLAALLALGQWLFTEKPEKLRLPYARELDRMIFNLGDNNATNFPYIREPVQIAYGTATGALLKASIDKGAKRGVLILGESNAGKTRLAFEALVQTLPDWPVLRLYPDSSRIEALQVSELQVNGLAVFVDDLQEFVPKSASHTGIDLVLIDSRATALQSLINSLRETVHSVVVVATCRTEDEERIRARLNWLFTELVTISLPRFNVDPQSSEATEIIKDFQRHGSTHAGDWDGTPGSLVLGLSKKNSQYLEIMSTPPAAVLRAMKLLALANIPIHTEEMLQRVCASVFDERALLKSTKAWQVAVNQLTQLGFVLEGRVISSNKLALVIRKDIYFNKVIDDYPKVNRSYQFEEDLTRLQEVLLAMNDADALTCLGDAYLGRDVY